MSVSRCLGLPTVAHAPVIVHARVERRLVPRCVPQRLTRPVAVSCHQGLLADSPDAARARFKVTFPVSDCAGETAWRTARLRWHTATASVQRSWRRRSTSCGRRERASTRKSSTWASRSICAATRPGSRPRPGNRCGGPRCSSRRRSRHRRAEATRASTSPPARCSGCMPTCVPPCRTRRTSRRTFRPPRRTWRTCPRPRRRR